MMMSYRPVVCVCVYVCMYVCIEELRSVYIADDCTVTVIVSSLDHYVRMLCYAMQSSRKIEQSLNF
jgi:hypothetical protein